MAREFIVGDSAYFWEWQCLFLGSLGQQVLLPGDGRCLQTGVGVEFG
jgi:hypothetical protein